MVKLDLGAGARSPDGYTPLGNAHGSQVFPLPHADGSVDAIRASHVLEHFPHGRIVEIVKDWVRALRPGGVLRIAVPDFAKIAALYSANADIPAEAYIMGGQTAADDFHRSLFDEGKLKEVLAAAGLVLLRRWQSELGDDAASLPISLNIEGTKPFASEIKVSAAMSVPRLGFMDNFFSSFEAFVPLGIKMRRCGGAFWGQALTNCIECILDEDAPDAVLTLDYDSVFTKWHVAHLMQLMLAHPEADAIAALQSSRHLSTALFTAADTDGKPAATVDLQAMRTDLFPVRTAHFGLTLLRADKLRALPRPWFHSKPDADGRWTLAGRTDDDVAFWRTWTSAGNSLFIAPRAAIGHIEVMVRWPGKDLQAIWQPMSEWNKEGAPEGAWK